MLRERWRCALRLTPATRAWFIDSFLCDSILLADFCSSFTPFLASTTRAESPVLLAPVSP
jgi:hypothetical protein